MVRMLDSHPGDTGSSPVAVINVRVVEWQTHPAKNRHTEGSTPSTDTNGARAVPAADIVFRLSAVHNTLYSFPAAFGITETHLGK